MDISVAIAFSANNYIDISLKNGACIAASRYCICNGSPVLAVHDTTASARSGHHCIHDSLIDRLAHGVNAAPIHQQFIGLLSHRVIIKLTFTSLAAMFEAVFYQLPKSVSFHQAVRGKPREALGKIQDMLGSMAENVQLGHSISLNVDPPSEWTEASVATACLDEARRRFGMERNPHESGKSWELGTGCFEDAIAFALSDEQWPRQKAGPLSLHVAYHFNWRDFSNEFPEPLASWENGTCSLVLYFHRRALSVGPSLVFPVPYESPAFQPFVDRLASALPFEIKSKYLRRMLVNPKNGATRYLRLA